MKRIVFALLCLPILLFGTWKYSKSESSQLFGKIVNRVETTKKVVALTFDDGPTSEYTKEILNILESSGVKATFFLVGTDIQSNPVEAQSIVAAGHELGNHSFTHARMLLKGFDFVKTEIDETNKLIRKAGYTGKIHFRPPYGKKLFVLPYYLDSQNITSVTWDVAPDSVLPLESSPEKLAQYAISNAKPGSVILMHVMFKSRRNSMAAVPKIISGLKEKGYEFVTVSRLLSDTNRS
ncbi:polysaccharide deacetylase family protein [Microbulbifer magnicolonia]|uniref:polysaccharide deacetylase family protein n=1 Tax=Microbulbifer magnicolonia TaxID=3109744 RepID=UPI002B40F9CE|nr:polysaccharide deacetylase family protein [Microbulbifer sp. GG15]